MKEYFKSGAVFPLLDTIKWIVIQRIQGKVSQGVDMSQLRSNAGWAKGRERSL